MKNLLPELTDREILQLSSMRKTIERTENVRYNNLNVFTHSVYGGKMLDDIKSLRQGQITFFEKLSKTEQTLEYETWRQKWEEEEKKELLEFSSEKEKRDYFELNKIFDHLYDEKKDCLHCGETIKVEDFKVFDGFICCPNYPKCDGTIIDWMPEGSLNSEKVH